MPPQRIALIGFMGAGKTTVGAILAARLGWDFVDTDALIEVRAGAPVAAIFRERGEQAFRDLEADVLAELAQRQRAVIATGGGAPAQEGAGGSGGRDCQASAESQGESGPCGKRLISFSRSTRPS